MTKRKYFIEILLVFGFLWIKGVLVNHLSVPWGENLVIVASYAADVLLILFFIIKIDKEPVSGIGIKRITFSDILGGAVLGLFLYLVQVLPPVIFMHMDISQFSARPQWMLLFFRFLFLMVTVGLGEELAFRGFLLQKLERIVKNKTAAVFFDGLLFYILHLAAVFTFDWTYVYSTFATTIVLSVYLYSSRKRSIFPLIIAHAMLDTLLGAPGFYLLNLFWQ